MASPSQGVAKEARRPRWHAPDLARPPPTKLLQIGSRELALARRPAFSQALQLTAQTFQRGTAAHPRPRDGRLSAKESLLLAFKDAGGFEALVSGKTTEMQRIDVNERIVVLERLNPTPRPTTSPFLEGRWDFEWFGDSSPGAFAARLLFERSPTAVAHFTGLDVSIKDGYSKLSSNLKFLNTIQSKFLLTTQLSVEGPIRMKEEYVEGLIEIPIINEESLPKQLKGLLGQTAGALQQLPSPIKDAVSEGLKVPLGELIDNFLQTTANQLTVYGYISNNLWFKYMFSIDYLAQFDNTSGNSDLELAIALQQQEFERQPQRFQAPPPQQQQQ
ncbi:unnamed protein product [Miscanthus lutarioriparius]|uniref:Plastid lipid-associated protein/fibrillin conserved domain-containing protein n=1 Tax=Miscanthus lutarioriparius TaxID=422564 RepID=A0A811NE47_9POAL|nr:unnamed protein product [Miscanthus lutarioriparius]